VETGSGFHVEQPPAPVGLKRLAGERVKPTIKAIKTIMTACLAAISATAQTDRATVSPLLEQAIQPQEVTAYELRRFIAKKIPALAPPGTAEQWTAQARQLRTRLLNEIVYHGWPREWVDSGPKFEDLGIVASGSGYRTRKLRYEIVPGFQSTALLYEPAEVRGKVPAVLNVHGHVGPEGKAIEFKQQRCINQARQGMLALSLEWMAFGELANHENEHWFGAHLDLAGANAVGLFYLAMRRGLDCLYQHPVVDRERIGVTGLRAQRKVRQSGLQLCLERIQAADAGIHAWVQVLPQSATGNGELSDIPFGAKDVIETRGLATEYGSPIYKGRVGTVDAVIVQELRRRGAILLGKTHTAAFAHRDPAPTRNPRNPEHTPGGSSSGSAAAVAASMVPFALGTQTLGSVLRPASYCGVTGFKASYGLFSLDGVLLYARSLDTLGFFTHTPDDMLLLWRSLGHPIGREEDFVLGAPELALEVTSEMNVAFQSALSLLRKAGVSVREVEISGMLSKLHSAAQTVASYEGARAHEQRFKEYGERLGQVATLVREGLQIPAARYDEAKRYIFECRARMAEIYKATPVILAPAATGPAPLGLAYTGDARMNSPWTALGTPAISIPMPVVEALPLGLQLTAVAGDDARLLRTAVRMHRILNKN
jgi:Asp-tRNA(Asn)/Glu-tRNA(Gln) amidotransferase A subunit family amidase